jgi:hypothetical protein
LNDLLAAKPNNPNNGELESGKPEDDGELESGKPEVSVQF